MVGMMATKSCPRCKRGDVYDVGYEPNEWQCLQCGHILTEAQVQRLTLALHERQQRGVAFY